jgi:AcrR family transcriptional regulator
MTRVATPPADLNELTIKGRRTRQQILTAAIELLEQQGYEGTNMRAIARRAGVSLGQTYYYFPSKQHMVLAFYEVLNSEHLDVCVRIIAEEKDLHTRLRRVVLARLASLQRHRKLIQQIFSSAVDPNSPLSPFSSDSANCRRICVELFTNLLASFVPAEQKRKLLGLLLWLYFMAVVLFWIHDKSPDCAKTQLLVEKSCKLMVGALQLLATPLAVPLMNQLSDLADQIGLATLAQ